MIIEDFSDIKKGELHVHLNGLFDSKIIKEIIDEEKIDIPKGFDIDKDLNALSHKHSLVNYLKPWDVLRLIPNKIENLKRLIESGFVKLKQDNVQFVELRSSVIYLSLLLKINLEETLSLLLAELNNASAKYHISFGLILTIPRGEYSIVYLTNLLNAFQNIGKPNEVVGLDLAGNEDFEVSRDLAIKFKSAKDSFGLGITIHAGETGNAKNIKEAVIKYGADRIGHGTAAGKTEDIMEFLAKKNICVEICPISNRRTGAVNSKEAHPVKSFIKFGVPFVICSDNPSIHDSPLSNDYLDFYKETKRLDIIENMFSQQMKYTFIKNYGN